MRQSVEVTVVDTARNQVVTSTFRGATRQHRSFDIDETLLIQVVANGQCGLVTQLEVTLHVQATQIKHAVSQTRRFRQVFIVEMERRRFGLIENFQFAAKHFNATGDQVRIVGAFGTGANKAHDFQAVFVTNGFSGLEDLGIVRVTNNLQKTFAVTQVDKDNTAVVTAAVSPTIKGHRLANELLIDKTGIFGAHKCSQYILKGMIPTDNRAILA